MPDKFSLRDLAEKFAPTYIPSEGEECYLVEFQNGTKPKILLAYPPWKPCIYYHVELLLRADQNAYVINYFSIWDRDTGGPLFGSCKRHKWDVERTAILVIGPEKSNSIDDFEAERAYFAAHEGQPLSGGEYLDQLSNPDKGVNVYWSLGKHASYAEPKSGWLPFCDQFHQPDDGDIARPPNYTLRDASSEKWFSYAGKWHGIESVSYKLKYRPIFRFDDDVKGWIYLQEGTATEENVKAFQRAIGHKETGLVDLETFERSQMLSPDLIRNAFQIEDYLFMGNIGRDLENQESPEDVLRAIDIDLLAENLFMSGASFKNGGGLEFAAEIAKDSRG
jgi:hypothetical protein